MSVEGKAAIKLLTRAVELDNQETGKIEVVARPVDNQKRKTEALALYQEGVEMLIQATKTIKDNPNTVLAYKKKAQEAITRAEQLKMQINQDKKEGKFHEQVRIENDSEGHSYETLFGRFFESDVIEVAIEDPYIRAHHQIINLLRLCELMVKKCPDLKTVIVRTSRDPQAPSEQANKLEEINKSLSKRGKGVGLKVEFSETMHDREIKLSTGWIIKIGRGLDIYKAASRSRSYVVRRRGRC